MNQAEPSELSSLPLLPASSPMGAYSSQEDCKPSSHRQGVSDEAPVSRDVRPLSFDRLALNFARHVDRSGGPKACWPWTATLNSKGYGCIGFRCADGVDRRFLAHRIAWMLTTGQPLLPEIQICHRCDNRVCCNTRHMFAGSNSDNVRDAINKGRRPGLQKVTT